MKNINTIKKNYYIRRIIQKGKKSNNKMYLVAYFRNRYNHNRLAILVNKKLGNSVTRNRQKRLVREANRILRKDLKTGFDIVIKVKDISKNIFESIENLKDIYTKLGIYEENINKND